MQPWADSLGRVAVHAEVGGATALSSQVKPTIGREAVLNEGIVEGGVSCVVYAINIFSRKIVGRDELVVDPRALGSGHGVELLLSTIVKKL